MNSPQSGTSFWNEHRKHEQVITAASCTIEFELNFAEVVDLLRRTSLLCSRPVASSVYTPSRFYSSTALSLLEREFIVEMSLEEKLVMVGSVAVAIHLKAVLRDGESMPPAAVWITFRRPIRGLPSKHRFVCRDQN